MSLSGIYIAPRNLIVFGSELLWLAISAALLVSVNSSSVQALSFSNLVYQSSLIVAIYVSIFYMMDLYDLDLVTPRRALLINLAQSIGLLCVIIGGLEAGTRILRIDPRFAAAHLLLTGLFVISARAVIDRAGLSGQPWNTFGVVAEESVSQRLERENEQRGDLHLRIRWIGNSIEQALDVLNSFREPTSSFQRLLIDPELLDAPGAVGFVRTCKERGLDLDDLRRFAERWFGKVILAPRIVREIGVSPSVSRSRVSRAVGRARDIVISCFALLVTLPITILTMLAVKIDSKGPVFFKQTRVGENGRPFTMIKFRSMYQPGKANAEWAWTTREADPRITRLGRFMRLSHIDELPQLINVIKGEMSLVGPRPFHPMQVVELESKLPYFGLRHLVLPGVTGWAQIRCDYDASTESCEELLSRDLFYVKHGNFLLDALIMLDTIRVCIWQKGAR